jgi:hypothetical protein
VCACVCMRVSLSVCICLVYTVICLRIHILIIFACWHCTICVLVCTVQPFQCEFVLFQKPDTKLTDMRRWIRGQLSHTFKGTGGHGHTSYLFTLHSASKPALSIGSAASPAAQLPSYSNQGGVQTKQLIIDAVTLTVAIRVYTFYERNPKGVCNSFTFPLCRE